MQIDRLLIKSYIEGKLSKKDKRKLSEWKRYSVSKQKYLEKVMLSQKRGFIALEEDQLRTHLGEIKSQVKDKKQFAIRKIQFAACIVLLIGLSFTLSLFYSRNNDNAIQDVIETQRFETVILSTADGENYKLENQVLIEKALNQVSQSETSKAGEDINQYTISVPQKTTWEGILPDGSRIILNAESELKVKSNLLTDAIRAIELVKGELYIEVKKNPDRPFTVSLPHGDIEVLGTIFNVNCYNNDCITLIEGSLKVNTENDERLLSPNQQSIIEGGKIITTDVNPLETVAWKNHTFYFANQKLSYICDELTRWYGQKIIFKNNKLKDKEFFLQVSRESSLNSILEALSTSGSFRFTINDDTIIIE
ncbi:MAG: FecR family protein [Marinifilaceae bacterium]